MLVESMNPYPWKECKSKKPVTMHLMVSEVRSRLLRKLTMKSSPIKLYPLTVQNVLQFPNQKQKNFSYAKRFLLNGLQFSLVSVTKLVTVIILVALIKVEEGKLVFWKSIGPDFQSSGVMVCAFVLCISKKLAIVFYRFLDKKIR